MKLKLISLTVILVENKLLIQFNYVEITTLNTNNNVNKINHEIEIGFFEI